VQLVRGRHGASSRLDNMEGKVQPEITDHTAKNLKDTLKFHYLMMLSVSRLHSVNDIWLLMNIEELVK
jgi:hypothetical protein